jgi:hypothetical protein
MNAHAQQVASACAALDRRAFLRGVGVAAAVGMFPLGCGSAPSRFAPPPGRVLHQLTPRTYAVLNAAAEPIVGPQGAALIRARSVDPAARADAFLASAPAFAPPLSQALLALEFGVWPLLGKVRPFTALEEAGREQLLSELAGSRLALKRMLFSGVRAIVLLGFYTAPEGRALTGLPAPGVTIEDAMTYPLEA